MEQQLLHLASHPSMKCIQNVPSRFLAETAPILHQFFQLHGFIESWNTSHLFPYPLLLSNFISCLTVCAIQCSQINNLSDCSRDIQNLGKKNKQDKGVLVFWRSHFPNAVFIILYPSILLVLLQIQISWYKANLHK